MTEHLKVTATLPRKRYVANGTQTVFTFDFVLFRPEELLVTANGTPVTSGVSVAVLANGTGSATFATAPIAGTIVVVQRRLVIKRETDFQEGGDLRAKTLNDEFDFQTAALQQVEAAAARSLSLPIDDADNAASTLPIAALRANKLLAFDNAGNPVLSNQTLGAIEAGSDSAALSATAAATSAGASASSAGAAAASQNAAATSAANAAIQATAAAASAASIALPIALASGGTGATSASAARGNLGLGTAAVLNVGTTANQIPQLDGSGRLPAVDGSQLTNVAGAAVPIVAGEALAIRDLVYQDVFNQRGGGADRWYKVDSDAIGPVRVGPRIGIALAAIASGASGSAQVRAGRVSGFSGLAAGQAVYASATVGAITQAAPAIPASGMQNATRLVGYAASATELDFDPDDDTVFTARSSALAVDGACTVQHWPDAGARERQQAAYLVQVGGEQIISQGTGTAIGNMTLNGGLAAAFDGNLNQISAACAANGDTPCNIGKDWGSGVTRTVVRFRVRTPSNFGDLRSNGGSATITLRGSSDNFSASNVSLYSGASGAPGASAWIDVTSGINVSTAYRYHRLDIAQAGAGGCSIAELEFYETAVNRDEPLTIGGSVANSAATDRVNVRYDDGSGTNADTRTTFVNRSGATRDIAVEVVL
jgi:hypothetical protein